MGFGKRSGDIIEIKIKDSNYNVIYKSIFCISDKKLATRTITYLINKYGLKPSPSASEEIKELIEKDPLFDF